MRLPKGEVGEDGCRLIGSLLLAGLWQATVHRSRIPETERLDAAIYLDEAQNFLHVPVGVDDALAEARGLRVSWTVAHQYLGQLNRAMAAGVSANARNKIYFSLAPDDAAEEARHVAPWLDAADLTRLGAFEAVLRPIAGGRALPPVTVDTLPAPQVIAGRAAHLRDAARRRTGLDWPTRRKLHIDTSAGRPDLLDQPAAPAALGAQTPTGRHVPESLSTPWTTPS